MSESLAFGYFTDGAGLGSGAGSVVPSVSESFAFGGLANGAGLGLGAGSVVPNVVSYLSFATAGVTGLIAVIVIDVGEYGSDISADVTVGVALIVEAVVNYLVGEPSAGAYSPVVILIVRVDVTGVVVDVYYNVLRVGNGAVYQLSVFAVEGIDLVKEHIEVSAFGNGDLSKSGVSDDVYVEGVSFGGKFSVEVKIRTVEGDLTVTVVRHHCGEDCFFIAYELGIVVLNATFPNGNACV